VVSVMVEALAAGAAIPANASAINGARLSFIVSGTPCNNWSNRGSITEKVIQL
jgi:hypothetical protein